jgi:SAM-dependent methyltransferase
MILVWIVLIILFITFAFVVFFGAPYVPTLKKQQTIAIDLLKLKPGQVFYDLGCGDGRLLNAAAAKNVKAVGYEINPLLAGLAWLRTRQRKTDIEIVCGNFWKANLSDADAVFVFLVERHMKRLDKFLSNQFKDRATKVMVASFGFKIPNRKITAKQGAIFLYEY